MKKILLAGILLLSAIGASAQLHVDLRVGTSAAALGDRHLKMGLRGGVDVSYLFLDRVGFRTGLHYIGRGTSLTSDVFDSASATSARLSYLDLPVEAVGSFPLSPRTRLEVHGGCYVARLIDSSLPDAIGQSPRGWDAGVTVGIDFAIGRFILGPEIQYGLVQVLPGGNSRNIAYSLSLGYRF